MPVFWAHRLSDASLMVDCLRGQIELKKICDFLCVICCIMTTNKVPMFSYPIVTY